MSVIKPFPCVRPAQELAASIAALPYDVYNRAEAKAKVQGDDLTFLRIDRPETQFPDDQDMYAPCVYEKAAQMLAVSWPRQLWMITCPEPSSGMRIRWPRRSRTGSGTSTA